MSTGHSRARTPDAPALEVAGTTTPPLSPSFEERWAAWQAKGEAHDRAVRRKVAIAAPFVAIVVGAVFYALLVL